MQKNKWTQSSKFAFPSNLVVFPKVHKTNELGIDPSKREQIMKRSDGTLVTVIPRRSSRENMNNVVSVDAAHMNAAGEDTLLS